MEESSLQKQQSLRGTFGQEGRLRLSDRNSILMT